MFGYDYIGHAFPVIHDEESFSVIEISQLHEKVVFLIDADKSIAYVSLFPNCNET